MTLNRWSPGLIDGGPERAGARTIDAVPADLRRTENGELIVTPVAGLPWTDAAEPVILSWAATIGYRRIWLPGRVVELDHEPAIVLEAVAECPTCGARWRDGSVRFWERVRANGWFPGGCLACGGSLPEWSIEAVGAGDAGDAAGSSGGRASRGRPVSGRWPRRRRS